MELGTDVFDLWTFTRHREGTKYLLLRTSQEKADQFFGGGRFWQIPGGFFTGNQDPIADLRAACDEIGLKPLHLYAVEHVSLIFNRRRARVEAIPVFAAELDHEQSPTITWEHCEFLWTDAEGVQERIGFRGLLEGMDWTRRYISEVPDPLPEFRLS